MTSRSVEPTRLGPWLIDARTPEDPWTFNCHNDRTGQRAIVEVHFSDDLAYGDALRAAAMDSDSDWQALGSSRLVLRPGEHWYDQPPGEFIFWVAWEDPNEALYAPTEMAQRPISFEKFTEERESTNVLRAYPFLIVLGLIAAALGVYLLVTVVLGGKSSSTPGLTTLADGSKSVSCGTSPININQGDHAAIPLDKASLGSYQLSSVAASPVSKTAVAQGLTATVGPSNTLVLDAGNVPGQAGRLDEYAAILSLVKGNTKVSSSCQVLVRAPATAPNPTPAASISPTPAVSPTPAAASTYTVVAGDTLNGIAAKQNIPADQRAAWVTQVKTLNNLTSDSINLGATLKLPPKP